MTEIELLKIIEEGGERRNSLLNPAVRRAIQVGLIPETGTPEDKLEYWSKMESVIVEFLTEAWRYSDIYAD